MASEADRIEKCLLEGWTLNASGRYWKDPRGKALHLRAEMFLIADARRAKAAILGKKPAGG